MSRCPNPEKIPHKTAWAALRARDSLEAAKGIDLALQPYRCKCGSWHLGHPRQTLRSVLSAGRKNAKAARRRRTR